MIDPTLHFFPKTNRYINRIILHCSATREGQDISTDTIRQWHLDRGWSDIGYHYVVELDGSIVKGRDINRTGAHVKGYNTGSIGIAYVGGCDANMNPKDTRTAEQIESLDMLIGLLMNQYPNATLHGHNEFSNKACPSFSVKEKYFKFF